MKRTPLRHRTWAFTALILCATLPVIAGAVSGTVITYASPGRIDEHCVILDSMPGGIYSVADKDREQAFCRIDFYTGSHALCPKVFSTSPGTLIYDISQGPFAGKPDAFEDQQCATSSPVKRGALGEPVSYKMTMNDVDTSATFATASLLYYHFSRFFNTDIHVPVSVYRSMDKDVHLTRVTQRGVDVSARRKGGAMNHAGWEIIQAAEKLRFDLDPAAYLATGKANEHKVDCDNP
jgi:hypothetical protein